MKIKRILIRASHGAAVGGVSLTILMLLALGLFGLFAGLTGGALSFLGSFISNLPAESYFSGVFCGAVCASVASIFTHGQKGAAVRSALYGGFVGPCSPERSRCLKALRRCCVGSPCAVRYAAHLREPLAGGRSRMHWLVRASLCLSAWLH